MNADLIVQWLDENERSIAWLARKIGRTRAGLHKSMKTGADIPASLALKISEVTGLDVRQICPPKAS